MTVLTEAHIWRGARVVVITWRSLITTPLQFTYNEEKKHLGPVLKVTTTGCRKEIVVNPKISNIKMVPQKGVEN